MPKNSYEYRRREHSNIEKRRGRYYAVMGVPRDLQRKLGAKGKRKYRFVASLETDSMAKARERVGTHLARWRAELAEARGEAHDDDAAFYRRALAKAKTGSERERIKDEIMLEAWDIGSRTVDNIGDNPSSSPQAQDFYSRATGGKVAFAAHLDEWLAQSHVTDKTKDMQRSDVQRFAKAFPWVQDATHAKAQQWATGLGVEPKTVRRILSALRGYWRYLQRSDVAAAPKDLAPFQAIELPRKSSAGNGDKRQPFANRDIPKLLKAADGHLRDLIELAAYSGCRIEELCMLKLADVHKTHFSIVSGKTEAAVRDVPIHPKLRKTVARLRKASGDGYLLSGLPENKYGDRSNAIGKRFGRLKKQLGFDGRYVFHSVRKTVATQLEDAGVSEVVAARILGHALKTMSYGLYSGGVSLAVKAKALAKVRY